MKKQINKNFSVTGLKSNPHFQTIIPHLFRKLKKPPFKRERIIVDNDFIDLDWVKNKKKKLLIILPGLESNAERHYIYGAITNLTPLDYDFLVLNYRGCSGTDNKTLRSYHGGFTSDLRHVINQLDTSTYTQIDLLGFCLGGNIVLKYAGEDPNSISSKIKNIIGISVPCDLSGCSSNLNSKENAIYQNRFLKELKNKIIRKSKQFPDAIDTTKIQKLNSIYAFDDFFTSRSFGYKNADEYYKENSSLYFLKHIKHNTLIISAQDDPFLSQTCIPLTESQHNKNITLLNPKHGGHIGFMTNPFKKVFWHEERIFDFLSK